MKFAYLIEPPFNFRCEDGAVSGCDVELARYVFSALGIDAFEPVETEFSALLPGLAANRWRMTTGLFATEERQNITDFSRPIWALPDGLLVADGNPLKLEGYQSVAINRRCILAVIKDQFQHRSAVEFGVPESRIMIFDTYKAAAAAVRDGRADAYASVGRAHAGFLKQHADWALAVITVPASEKPPAYGSFAFAPSDTEFRHAVNDVLDHFVGTSSHRQMMARYGFSGPEIDLLVS